MAGRAPGVSWDVRKNRDGEARGVSKERSGESLCYSGALSREKDSVKEAVSARTSC